MRILTVLAFCLMLALPAQSQENFSFFGDFRGRVELDRSSDKSDGTIRDDRDRMRVRGRFGFNYTRSERVAFGMRVRTGDPASVQSPHVTLGDGFSHKPLQIDKLFARVGFEGGSAWFGKNSNPFWHQNEMFWDDDVTLEGLSASYDINDFLEARVGYFILDTPSSNGFSDQSRMMSGQFVFSEGRFSGALGVRVFEQNPDQVDAGLQDMDYTLVTGSVYGSFEAGRNPVRVGIDISSNLEDYDSVMQNHDQTLAWVGSVRFGPSSEAGDWQLRYYYAHIEKYAVVGRFAQDDWVRWGSATSTRSSNFAGHEIRAVYTLGVNQNLVARFYMVDGLEKEATNAVSLESGTRIRLDWNISF